jgi:hypothetical protein
MKRVTISTLFVFAILCCCARGTQAQSGSRLRSDTQQELNGTIAKVEGRRITVKNGNESLSVAVADTVFVEKTCELPRLVNNQSYSGVSFHAPSGDLSLIKVGDSAFLYTRISPAGEQIAYGVRIYQDPNQANAAGQGGIRFVLDGQDAILSRDAEILLGGTLRVYGMALRWEKNLEANALSLSCYGRRSDGGLAQGDAAGFASLADIKDISAVKFSAVQAQRENGPFAKLMKPDEVLILKEKDMAVAVCPRRIIGNTVYADIKLWPQVPETKSPQENPPAAADNKPVRAHSPQTVGAPNPNDNTPIEKKYDVTDLCTVARYGLNTRYLYDMICRVIVPRTWRYGVGNISIDENNRRVVFTVTQARKVHEELSDLLAVLHGKKGVTPAEKRLEIVLGRPTVTIQEGTTLADAIVMLSKKHGIEIAADEESLKWAGIQTDAQIKSQVKGKTLEAALKLIADDLHVAFTPESGKLIVGSPDKIAAVMSFKVYPVTDVCKKTVNPDGSFLFDSGDLVDKVKQIQPNTWSVNDGPGGLIAQFELNGAEALVVKQSYYVHKEIAKTLAQLRKGFGRRKPVRLTALVR